MIYTSYFAKLKSLPDNIVPISICGKAPDWYKGLQYKKLAPKYDFFMEWKKNHDKYAWCEHTLAKKNAFTELTPKSEGLPYCLACGQKLDWNTNDNTCICCGEIIPEGRQVCPNCERG